MLDSDSPNPFANADAMLAYSELSIEELKAMPCQTAVIEEADPEDVFRFAVQNDDGLIDCCPEVFKLGHQQAETRFKELSAEPDDQLKLITRRTSLMINSWMNNISVHKKSVHLSNPIWMHPSDADRLGLVNASLVRVFNDYGEVQAQLVIDETLKPGVVSMSHGWGNKKARGLKTVQRFPGANSNRLSPVRLGSYNILSNQSHMTGIVVKVERLQDKFTLEATAAT